jgi:hypothetical protein
MFRNTLPFITAQDIKSALAQYATLKSMFKPTSACMTKLKNLSKKLKDNGTSISNNEMIELIGILAFATGAKEKTISAIMPLKDKFKDQFWFAINQYQNYDRWIEIEHLREIYNNPKSATQLVNAYNTNHQNIEKQRAASVMDNDSKQDDTYTQLAFDAPKKHPQPIPDEKSHTEKDSFLTKKN